MARKERTILWCGTFLFCFMVTFVKQTSCLDLAGRDIVHQFLARDSMIKTAMCTVDLPLDSKLTSLWLQRCLSLFHRNQLNSRSTNVVWSLALLFWLCLWNALDSPPPALVFPYLNEAARTFIECYVSSCPLWIMSLDSCWHLRVDWIWGCFVSSGLGQLLFLV